MATEENETSGMLRAAAPYMTMGAQIAAGVVLFLFIGKYADTVFGTTPWLMVTGIILGFTGGMIHFFREVTALTKKEDDERRRRQ